ncbi:DnaJ DnaJ-class molecular chaperone with C-terminal Zn finger domain [uncultured Caudovirales phage]|uniref:DnaJ DnaJ-class molecular chaperone with C-terminal Zn finger domain n=1 Tax=uncultured Caudovirales phage TaxID=2100421 RepID=A0A6J5RXX2_9CAUD|nr:DnaJ DnaJ-class molecular chaperone with C-terminal Zn finger domain [uncultured Caudovirales phage]
MKLQEARDVLGVSAGASSDEVKKKYRELTKKYHPDVNKEPGSEDKFKKINEAYQCVSTGKSSEREENFNSGFTNPFSNFSNKRQNVDVEAIDLKTTLSFKESILGCKKELKFSRNGKCINCNGNGYFNINNGCDRCGGSGNISGRQGNMIFTRTCDKCFGKSTSDPCKLCEEKGFVTTDVSVTVNIPGGIITGNILRLGGMGNYAGSFMTMDQYTDAHLYITVTPDNDLSLNGTNVISTLDISLLDALRGCNKSVKTILGLKDIIIKPMSRNKDEVIISNAGVNGIGNQIVILDIKYPDNINKVIEILSNEVA